MSNNEQNESETALATQLALEDAASWGDPTEDECKPDAPKLPRNGDYCTIVTEATSGVNKNFGNYQIQLVEAILRIPGDPSSALPGVKIRSQIALPKVNPRFKDKDGKDHVKPEDWAIMAAFPAFFPDECPQRPTIEKGTGIVTYNGKEVGQGKADYDAAVSEWKRASKSKMPELYIDPSPFVGKQTYVRLEQNKGYVNVKKRWLELPPDGQLVDSEHIFGD